MVAAAIEAEKKLSEKGISAAVINIHTIKTVGYDSFRLSSGMYLKFIPYQPVIKVRGMKILVITVNRVMMLFCLTAICSLWKSLIWIVESLNEAALLYSLSTLFKKERKYLRFLVVKKPFSFSSNS